MGGLLRPRSKGSTTIGKLLPSIIGNPSIQLFYDISEAENGISIGLLAISCPLYRSRISSEYLKF